MRRLFFGLVFLAALVVGAALIIPALIPDEVLRPRAETAASDALGRTVTLEGDIALQILPALQVRAANAQIGNAPGFGDAPFAEMGELRASLALLPLLSRRVEVTEFVLVDPIIRLAQREDGANNWTFGAAAAAAPAAPAEGGFRRRPGALPLEAVFGDVRIENGTILYDAPGQSRRVEGLDLSVSLPSLDAPVRVGGAFSADGAPMRFSAEAASLRGAFEGAETAIDISLSGALADLQFDGRLLESEAFDLAGRVDLTLPLRALARFLGEDLPDGPVFREFSAQADLAVGGARIDLTNADVRFDDIAAEGALSLDYGRARPRLTGDVRAGRIDVTPYIPAGSESGGSGGSSDGVGAWSEERIDLAPLRLLDAALTARADQFKARDIEADDVAVSLTLENGVLTAGLSEFALYGGGGEVTLTVDSRASTPRFGLSAELDTLQAQPFLNAAAGFDRLQGLGGLSLELAGAGSSPATIMRSASGAGRFDFVDGAIVGVNLAQVIRTVETALETGRLPVGFADSQQTDFSSLGGSFVIQDGVARNDDLAMLSPLLRVTGAGEVDLAEQMVEFRLTPRAVQSLTGQGGDVDLQGLEVPIRLSGPFNNVSAGIDMQAVAAALIRARAGELLGLPGQRPGEEPPASPEEQARDALRSLLNRALGGEEEDEEPGGGEDEPG